MLQPRTPHHYNTYFLWDKPKSCESWNCSGICCKSGPRKFGYRRYDFSSMHYAEDICNSKINTLSTTELCWNVIFWSLKANKREYLMAAMVRSMTAQSKQPILWGGPLNSHNLVGDEINWIIMRKGTWFSHIQCKNCRKRWAWARPEKEGIRKTSTITMN